MQTQQIINYRPDIDGIRALAIIFVIFFHAGFKFATSGFIGVDIFFVISGYLITQLIQNALINDNFSIINFYKRRIWRLQPAFIVFFITAIVMAFIFLLPLDLLDFIKSARKTSAFISNDYFANVLSDYFSSHSETMPFLHTWSLSIEWQFYLLLPISLSVLYRFFPKKNQQIIVLSLLCIVFALLTLYFSKKQPGLSYFIFLGRIVEFLTGSLASLCSLSSNKKHPAILNILGIFCLSILISIVPFGINRIGYPNALAFLPCICTAYLLVLGTNQQNLHISQLLSSKPLVFIGRVSYSWYLWHWLFLAFIFYQMEKSSPLTLSAAIIASFIIACLSWYFIEKPSKSFSRAPFIYAILLMLIPITLSLACSHFIKKNLGYPQRFNDELRNIYQIQSRYEAPKRPLCVTGKIKPFNADCEVGALSPSAKRAFVIGDSYSNHYWNFFDVLGKQANIDFLFQSVSSCLALPDIKLYDWSVHQGKVYSACEQLVQQYYQKIEQDHFDYVVIGQFWGNYDGVHVINQLNDAQSIEASRQRIEKALNHAMQIITKSGATPVLVKSITHMKEDTISCFFKHIKRRTNYDPIECMTKSDGDSSSNQWYDKIFNKLKIKYPSLIIIDPKMVQCRDDLCPADIDGIPVYRDSGHLTDYAAYRFAQVYLQQFRNPFLG